MNDPFASLDPIQKPKTAAERVLTAAPAYNQPPAAPVAVGSFGAGGAPGHQHMNMGMSMGMAPGAPPAMCSGSVGMMNMNSMGMGGGGMNPSMGMGFGMNGMNGTNGMGGMNGMAPGGAHPGMGMGMGTQPPHNPFQQHAHQQQEPVMYDNIKNLLQQKPKAPAAFEDTASMDFLENLGGGGGGGAKTNSGSGASFLNPQVRAAEPTTAVMTDPFGGGFSSSPTSPSTSDTGLSIFETGSSAGRSSSTPVSPASSAGGAKSSALAARLANGRRNTQEMQRSQLQFNATAFTQPGGAAGPKISLKEMVGQAPSKAPASTEMSLDEFSSGRSASGGGGLGNSDDPFGMSFGSSNGAATTRTSSSSAVHQSSFEAASSRAESEPRPVDDHDTTLW